MGENGSGKSTLLKCILGLNKGYTGEIIREDRIGYFVTLEKDKIRKAKSDDFILGVISGNCSIIGNSVDDSWNEMYMKDEFGRFIYEDVEVEAEYDEIEKISEETGEIIKEKILVKEAGIERRIKINPNYDNTKEYISRAKRPEWDVVGMLGQVIVRDDGSCQPGCFCKCNDNSIATSSDSGYRVLKRINETTILILLYLK